MEESKCPVCKAEIDQDNIDVNNNQENGYGFMLVPCVCPSCGQELTAYYDAQDGYNFSHFEKA